MSGERYKVSVPGSSTHQQTQESEAKVPAVSSPNYLTDAAFHQEVIDGFKSCISKTSTTKPLNLRNLAEDTRILFNSTHNTNSFAVIPIHELIYFPAPFMCIKVKQTVTDCSNIFSKVTDAHKKGRGRGEFLYFLITILPR